MQNLIMLCTSTWRQHFLTCLTKTLTQLDALKQQTEFKFYGNDVGTLRKHIEFSQHFYSVANSAGKVDCNCKLKGLLVISGLRQLRQPVLPRLRYFGFRKKYFIVSYGMLIHKCPPVRFHKMKGLYWYLKTLWPNFTNFPNSPHNNINSNCTIMDNATVRHGILNNKRKVYAVIFTLVLDQIKIRNEIL